MVSNITTVHTEFSVPFRESRAPQQGGPKRTNHSKFRVQVHRTNRKESWGYQPEFSLTPQTWFPSGGTVSELLLVLFSVKSPSIFLEIAISIKKNQKHRIGPSPLFFMSFLPFLFPGLLCQTRTTMTIREEKNSLNRQTQTSARASSGSTNTKYTSTKRKSKSHYF